MQCVAMNFLISLTIMTEMCVVLCRFPVWASDRGGGGRLNCSFH